MNLDDRTIGLITLGASITANCQPCLGSSRTWALEHGADERDIAEAIEVGKRVRQGAASKMDSFAIRLCDLATPFIAAAAEACDCAGVPSKG